MADSGGQLSECCAHLAALQRVLDQSAGVSMDWNLVPTLVESFTCEPERWGFDPLTGCVSGSFLSVALREYYRRASVESGPGAWSLIVVKLPRSLDLVSAVMAEYSAGNVLVGAIPDAEIVAHIRPGVFAILTTTELIPQHFRRINEAMTAAEVASHITVQSLPPKLRQCRELVATGCQT